MQKVWIVFKNGKVDAVFDNEDAAKLHQKNATRGWNLTQVIEQVVYSL